LGLGDPKQSDANEEGNNADQKFRAHGILRGDGCLQATLPTGCKPLEAVSAAR